AWPQAPHLLAAAGTIPPIPPGCYVHLGLYAYQRDFLLQLAQLPQTPLERIEQLEQLRVLEHGYRILVVPTTYESVGVDTPEDVARAERLLTLTGPSFPSGATASAQGEALPPGRGLG